MNPDGALMRSHGGDDGTAILLHRHAFFFGRTKSDLFGLTVGKALAPQMAPPVDISREIHPRAIGRPVSRRACAAGADGANRKAPVERDEPAWPPLSRSVHLDDQGRFAIG